MYNDGLLKLNEEKNKVLVKMNFLLEGLQDVSDEDEKRATLELINKLKVRLEGINKQIESNKLTNQDNEKQVKTSANRVVEKQEKHEEEDIVNQDIYESEEVVEKVDEEPSGNEEPYEDEANMQETYDEEESEDEDTESPKVYVGRKDNGNILGYYHKVKKQSK